MSNTTLPSANQAIKALDVAKGQEAAIKAFGSPVRVQPLGHRSVKA